MDYADYLRHKYNLDGEDSEVTRPSTADISAFTQETEDFYVDQPRQPARLPTSSGGRYTAADRLSRNRAAKRAMSDVTTHNHLSTLYHMNRRIQEMYLKSGRKGYSPAGGVGTVEAAELARGGSGSFGSEHGLRPGSAGYGSRPGTGITPRIPGAPASPPSYHHQEQQQQRQQHHRPMSAPSPGRHALHCGVGAAAAQQDTLASSRPATSSSHAARGSPAREAAPLPSFTERRVKNTGQALKTAILNEIISNRIYEEKRLKQLFRSYLKLNSGEAFYPTLCAVVEDLKRELDVK